MAIERGRGGSRHSHQSHAHQYHYVKPFGEKVKDCCRSTIAFIFSNVGVCGLMVGYTTMGAYLFSTIESQDDMVITADLLRSKTIEELWNITVAYNVLDKPNWTANVTSVVSQYQKAIINLVGEGWDGGNTTLHNKWTIDGGFLYSLTVITTIGYGHISPHTDFGKMMTIIYTIFGMPVFLLYMANMGDILAKSLKWIYSKLCICKRPDPKFDTSVVWRSADATLRAAAGPSTYHSEAQGRSMYPAELGDEISIETGSWSTGHADKPDISTVNIPITVSLVIMVALLYGGTLLFEKYEGWDPLTSFYFCFISLTTIGFGDYVPGLKMDADGDEDKDMSFIFCSLYLMFGLALLSMCFNLMQEEVVHKITACLNAIRFFNRRETD
ncbi:two pore potassium channel protein sup-9-like [Panulirus ornatus]|uniref:two pore potassium channel protein sup-9-like n=1 Tax=Panulirus ornatus TaxID=150431 RepID=UPI003A8490AE